MPPLEEPKLDLDPLLDPLEVQLCRGYDDEEVDEDLAHELEEGRLEELEELRLKTFLILEPKEELRLLLLLLLGRAQELDDRELELLELLDRLELDLPNLPACSCSARTTTRRSENQSFISQILALSPLTLD